MPTDSKHNFCEKHNKSRKKCKICHKKYNKYCPLKSLKVCSRPQPPFLLQNFSWCGHYFVPDLNLDVPFTWNANNGNIQMIAGGPDYPIWFTNLIYNGFLYTFTYKWPGLVGVQKCDRLFPFTIDDLNTIFASTSFVGPEIIIQNDRCISVNHFRLSIALPRAPPGNHFRLPITSADIYVDIHNPSKIWKILHFGFQNLYDPNLDEWIIINKFKDVAGEVILPPECPLPNIEDIKN